MGNLKSEIMFRGRQVSDKRWVIGSLVISVYNTFIIPKYDDSKEGAELISIIPETVGQFTGLKDKAGKEIFEGDVVLAETIFHQKPTPLTCKVIYNSNEAIFEIVQYWQSQNDWKPLSNKKSEYIYEIIGNIHTNPELLTAKI